MTTYDKPPSAERRDFLTAVAGLGFALAARPVMAQSVIHTDAIGLVAGEVKIPVADGGMTAYRAQPGKGGGFPVILVVSEIFGVHEHIADLCRRLAKQGYLAIAPDLFQRQGDPRREPDMGKIMSNIVARTPDSQVMPDLDAAVAWAKANGGNTARLAITGFCWGGRITWMYAAHNPAVKAGVAWYGRLKDQPTANQPRHPIDVAPTLKVPVLGLYAGKDGYITQDQVKEMQAVLKRAGSASEIRLYPEADHGFNADYRPTYDKEAAKDGWQRMLGWFKKYGV